MDLIWGITVIWSWAKEGHSHVNILLIIITQTLAVTVEEIIIQKNNHLFSPNPNWLFSKCVLKLKMT